MITIILKGEEIQDMMFEEGWKEIESSIIDQSRWQTYLRVVVQNEDTKKHYQYIWSKGSTEHQEVPSPETLTLTEVEQREVTIRKWFPIETIKESV